MEIEELPIIDWDLAIKNAGNKREVAEEILAMMMKNLPREIAGINHSAQQKNYMEMGKQLHKLHGALCYCGLPRIRNLVARLEIDIKQDRLENLHDLVESLNKEVNLLMQSYSE